MTIGQFIKDNKKEIITIFILGLITYGIKLITYTYSIDTELFLADREATLSWWFQIGRFSLVLIKRIIDLPYINIWLANFVAYILLFLSVVICIYNVEKITEGKNKVANTLLGALIITSPIIVLQYNFTLQCVEICFSLLTLCLTFTIINKYILNKVKNYLFIIPIILTTFVFGSYQAFVPLFITFSAFFTILLIYYKKEDGIKVALKYIIIFLISFILYKLIDKIILNFTQLEHSTYLDHNIIWGNGHFLRNIMEVNSAIFNNLLENSDFHSFGLLLCYAELIYIIFCKFEKKNWKLYIAILVFMISPFLLTILTGKMPFIRARIQFPFVLGLGVYFIYLISQHNLEKKIYTIIFSIIIMSQIILSVKLLYTDYQKFKQEETYAIQIENDIMAKNIDDEKTKIFIGSYTSAETYTVYKVETVGKTFFDYDKNEPKGSNIRLRAFLICLGYGKYEEPTQEQYNEAKKIAENMPVYPTQGSIKEENDYVIIKIGE